MDGAKECQIRKMRKKLFEMAEDNIPPEDRILGEGFPQTKFFSTV